MKLTDDLAAEEGPKKAQIEEIMADKAAELMTAYMKDFKSSNPAAENPPLR